MSTTFSWATARQRDTPGNLNPGSETGKIIDHDHQEFVNGEWKWK